MSKGSKYTLKTHAPNHSLSKYAAVLTITMPDGTQKRMLFKNKAAAAEYFKRMSEQ